MYPELKNMQSGSGVKRRDISVKSKEPQSMRTSPSKKDKSSDEDLSVSNFDIKKVQNQNSKKESYTLMGYIFDMFYLLFEALV